MEQLHACILQSKPYGESHRLVTLLTRERGVLRAVAFGAQKQHSALYGPTSSLTQSQLLVTCRQEGLSEVAQGSIIDSYPDLRVDVLLLTYATAVGELVLRVSQDGNMARTDLVFADVVSAWDHLQRGIAPKVILAHVELRLLRCAGLFLDPFSCSECGAAIERALLFSNRCGGGLCASCAMKRVDPYALPVSASTWRVLQLLSRSSVGALRTVKVREETATELLRILSLFMAENAGIVLQSMRVAESL